MKRIALFVLTNLAIIVVLMLFLNVIGAVFGINFAGVGGRQLDIGALAVFALVVGFTGSFISLLISKPMAKWSTGARVIDRPANANLESQVKHTECLWKMPVSIGKRQTSTDLPTSGTMMTGYPMTLWHSYRTLSVQKRFGMQPVAQEGSEGVDQHIPQDELCRDRH